MSRKATRRAERAASLRRRILAGATTAILGLGLAVGGVTPAMAKVESSDPVPSSGTPTGQTTYEGEGGLVCDSDFVGFTKPTELDSPNLDNDGTYTADWGSLTWNAGTRTVSWVINAGWDVDVCVKGGTTLTTIDTSEFDGSSYVHTYAGLSHAGFFATPVSTEPVQPTATPTPENCLEGDGAITFGDVDGIASYSVAGIAGTFAPGATLSGLSADTYTVTATADENYELAADSSPFDVEVTSSTANCAEATAAVATSDPSCFSGETLNESAFSVSEGVTWSVIDDGDTSGSYEVLFTAPAGSLFSNGTSTLTATGTLASALPDDECVLPLTNASLAFTDATCVEPQALDVDNFVFDDTLAQLSGDPVVDGDGNYTVVFTAIGENTTFDQSPDVDQPGRTVSDSGKTLTFTGTLDGPNVELCEELPVVNDPFEYVDNCLTASYTLYYVEGLTYTVTVNDGEPFVVVFDENETQKTFPANPGDYVVAVPSADPGYVLGPNQPVPLDRTFATYPDGCQLPEFPNWPASATATDEACTPFGITSGSITVQFSTGPEGNPDPVSYYLAYGTAQQQELTSATTTLPAGDYVVTAVLTDPTDSINDSGSDPVSFPLTVGAASESDCDLPTLAITGATNAVTGVGIGAVIIILAGLGFVLRRQLVE